MDVHIRKMCTNVWTYMYDDAMEFIDKKCFDELYLSCSDHCKQKGAFENIVYIMFSMGQHLSTVSQSLLI